MKLKRLLQALSLVLVGAGLFAPAPWNWVIGVLAVLVALWLEWMSA